MRSVSEVAVLYLCSQALQLLQREGGRKRPVGKVCLLCMCSQVSVCVCVILACRCRQTADSARCPVVERQRLIAVM